MSVQIAVYLVGIVEPPGSPPAEFLVVYIDASVDNIYGNAGASGGVVVVCLELAIGGARDSWETPGWSVALTDNGERGHFGVFLDEVHLLTKTNLVY